MTMHKILLCLLAAMLWAQYALPQAAPAADPRADEMAKAREKLSAAEKDHPGNTVEMAAALDALVELQLDGEGATDETLSLVTREAAVAEAAAGPRSKAYVTALANGSEVYVALSRAAEGRPLAEKAFEIAQSEFPESEEGINADDELAYVCMYLGDYPCTQRADETAIAVERKPGPDHDWDLAVTLGNYADLKRRMGDINGAGAAILEGLAAGLRAKPNAPEIGIMENNAATHFIRIQDFPRAIEHLNKALDITRRAYGPDNGVVRSITGNLASVYSRTGQFALAWKTYETTVNNKNETIDTQANMHADFARSLASGGDLNRAIEEGLLAERMGRNSFVLQASILPERQALAYDRVRALGVDTAISVLARHPELPVADSYQEMIRSRALVADEMARRQKNLNASNDPQIASLLNDLNKARADLLKVEEAAPGKTGNQDAIAQATKRMEGIERELAERSAVFRNDHRASTVTVDDVRRNLPAHSVLISYVAFQRRPVERVDPARGYTPSYAAFVLHPDSDRIRIFDLGDAKTLQDLVASMRASGDAEAHAGGLGSKRNERAYREAGVKLRKIIWDPLRGEVGNARQALIVPDGILNLVPFSGLPLGNGYLIEHGPVIHMLSSERDLIPSDANTAKAGMLAIGGPSFDVAESTRPASPLRDTPVDCDAFRKLIFDALPGSAQEVRDISITWRRWEKGEPFEELTGAEATRANFLEDAPSHRVLHVATHAFVLDRSCGDGNPLLHSGLVFAGANRSREASILTAQQIASLDLSGVDLAVLSACNTGNGELRDGEGVLGLQRAFRIAGARSVVMTIWPVDDKVTGSYMHELYGELLVKHETTADAAWFAARKLLLDRRAAGLSTHPWYWAGYIASGGE